MSFHTASDRSEHVIRNLPLQLQRYVRRNIHSRERASAGQGYCASELLNFVWIVERDDWKGEFWTDALLATLLSRSPDAELISLLASLDGDPSPIGAAHTALGEAAARTSEQDAEREFLDLFVGLGRGLLLPYSSHYQTGTLYGRPLARLRQTLQLLGIKKAEDRSEPEDHAAILCEIMASLIGGTFASPVGADREFFEQHLAPWIKRFQSILSKLTRPIFTRRGFSGAGVCRPRSGIFSAFCLST